MSLLPPGITSVAGLGGRSLGTAQGSIRIDTSDAERARLTMQRVGQDIARAVQPIDTALKGAQRTIREFRGELLAIGAAGAVLTRIGLDGARSMLSYRVSFQQLLGSEREAVALMGDLTDSANQFGIEVEEVWQLARALLPTLEGNTEELDKFVKRAALLASTNPLKSTADAARAIQEYLAGQHISLQRLFNVDPNIIAEARSLYDDVGAQLDYILGRLGATEEGAREMADAFVGVRNEVKLALAEGFAPLFQQLQPLATSFREFVQELRQSNPEILTLGAGMTSAAAAGAPLLLLLGQMLSLLEKIRAIKLPASLLAALGVVGGTGVAVAGGVGVGIQATRAIGRATGDDQLAQSNLADLWRIIKQTVVALVNMWTQVNGILAAGVALAAERFADGVAHVLRTLAGFADWLTRLTPGKGDDDTGDKIRQFADDLQNRAGEAVRNFVDRLAEAQQEITRGAARTLFPELRGLPELTRGQRADAARYQGQAEAYFARQQAAARGYSDEQMAVIMGLADAIQQVEATAAQQRLDATRQYEEQRTRTIENYERMIARDAEDFARQRAREEADLQAAIAEVRVSQAEREADQVRKHNRRIADLQEDHARRLLQIQQDYNGRIREAASGLDARSVANLQRQRADALRNERESFRDRYAQEMESHQERLQLAREADAQRIRDMVAALRERQRREDEDRRIRLQRQADDHRRQLQLLDSAHRSRLSQIQQQAYNERRALLTAYQQRLADVGIHNRQYATLQQARQQESLRLFNRYFNEIVQMQNEMLAQAQARQVRTTSSGITHIPGIPGRFQTGGDVPRTGLYTLERGEHVLQPWVSNALRAMFGGQFSGPQLVGALAGGRGGSAPSLNIGAINVTAAPGQQPQDVARAVRKELISLLKEL